MLTETKEPYIIAEIGINHNGDMEIAKKLIDIAVFTGCNAAKFQKRTLEVVYSKEELDKERESPWGTTNREQKAGLEFSIGQYDEINAYCQEKGIDFMFSAWDIESQKKMAKYNCKYNKVASAMMTHYDLVEEIAKEGKHTFVSTGMTKYDEVDKAVEIFKKHNCPITLLHTISTYPCTDEECNIKAMIALKERYNLPVGYSGHETGILPTIIAVVLGATVVERHITLNRAMYGSDQAASLELKGLDYITKYSKSIHAIIGNGEKSISDGEQGVAKKLRYFVRHSHDK